MKNIIFAMILGINWTVFAQVGIGTVDPSAQLEIVGTNTGIPNLELNPQSAPIGTATGQLAVIGDLLYMYDATRVKWLSVESTALQFGSNGEKANEYLRFGGDVREVDSGARMPYNGTITAITITSANAENKTFQIHLNGSAEYPFTMLAGEYTNTTANIDFSAGDYVSVFITTGDVVSDAAAIVWVKWRK